MNLHQYFLSLPSAQAREDFARRCGSRKMYFHQLACRKSNRRPSPALAKRIHEESGGAVDLHELRPDIWSPPTRSEAA